MRTPTAQTLLDALPPYRNEWVLIHPDQTVGDIVAEVLDAHQNFSGFYDRIALFFDGENAREISETLFQFCKENFTYNEQGEDEQLTATPQGLLTWGHTRGVDCKNYAGFCGGICDGLNRLAGAGIKWAYRFASYDPLDNTPHHVFIVIKQPGGGEIWLDPTPGSQDKTPAWQIDKTVKAKSMALVRNIAGVDHGDGPDYGGTIGIASLTLSLRTDSRLTLGFTTCPWPYATPPWPKYLGLDWYRDYGGDRNISEDVVAAAINNAIANGPAPGHTVNGQFVKWIYDNSIRNWNFYYPGGVDPTFDYTKFIPPGAYSWIDSAGHRQTIPHVPELVLTADGRLTFDRDAKLDDYRNWYIYVLTAAIQRDVNAYDDVPYPVTPANVKIFSQDYTGNPGNPNANLFHEHRGTGFITDVGHVLEHVVNVVKDDLIKVVGIVPRNAFLSLVGLNVFHLANDLQEHINSGHWDEIAKTWTDLGGNPDRLKNTIEHGSTVPELTDTTHVITSQDQISGAAIGNPAIVAAVITAAAPILLALAKFLSHNQGAGLVNNSSLAALNAAHPGANYSLGPNGQVYSNGVPVNFTGTTDQAAAGSTLLKNVLISGAVAGVLYYIMNPKNRPAGSKKKIIVPVLAGGVTFYFLNKRAQAAAAAAATPAANYATLSPAGTSPAGALVTAGTDLVKTLLPLLGQGAEASPQGDYFSGGGTDTTGPGTGTGIFV